MAGDVLTDQDELGQFPSAANPLTAMGIDPDMVRANPEMLNALTVGNKPMSDVPKAPLPGPMPAQPMAEPAAPSVSAKTAGELGGAAATPTATAYGMAGLGSLQNDANLATQAATDIPTSSPEAERLAAQRQRLAAPTPLYDPATGKMLSSTTTSDGVTINPQASTGRKVWRGVRGGLIGLATGGLRGAIAGAIDPKLMGGDAYGAPDAAYQHAEQQRQAELGATDTAEKSAMDNWKEAVEAQKARAATYGDAGKLNNDLVTGADNLADLPNKTTTANADLLRAQNDTPDAKGKTAELMEQAKINTRRNDPTAQSLPKGYIRSRYILTGEIQAAHEATGEERNVAALQSAWKTAHPGQKMTETDLASIYREAGGAKEAAGKTPADNDDQVSGIVADATQKKQEYADQFTRQADGSYLNTNTYKRITGQEFNDKIDGFRTAANQKLSKYHASVDAQGNVVRSSQDQQPKAPVGPPAGATGHAMGADGKLHWVDSVNRRDLGVAQP